MNGIFMTASDAKSISMKHSKAEDDIQLDLIGDQILSACNDGLYHILFKGKIRPMVKRVLEIGGYIVHNPRIEREQILTEVIWYL